MRLSAWASVSLLCLLLLVGCQQNYFSEIEMGDIPGEDPSHPVYVRFLEALEEPEGTALLEVDAETGHAYLLVTTGEENKIQRALKITGNEYDSDSRAFTLYLTNHKPKMGQERVHSSQWMSVVQFRKHSFETLRVVVDMEEDEDDSEQRVYELALER